MDEPADPQDAAPPRLQVPRPRRVDPIKAPAGRYRSAMLRRFGLAYWLSSLGVLMGRVRFEEHSAENIRRAAAKGPLVYVLHTRSRLDWLALNAALNRNKLPLAAFTTGIVSTPFRPVFGALREWWGALRARLVAAVVTELDLPLLERLVREAERGASEREGRPSRRTS